MCVTVTCRHGSPACVICVSVSSSGQSPPSEGTLFAYIAADGTIAVTLNPNLGIAVRIEHLQSTMQSVFTTLQTFQNCRAFATGNTLSTLSFYVRFAVSRVEYYLFQSSVFTSLSSMITNSFGGAGMADWR